MEPKHTPLPCPFCNNSDLRVENLVLEAVVCCRKCKATIVRNNVYPKDDGLKQAKIAWNTRTESKRVKELEEALHQAVLALHVYVNGGNPNSPYKDGKHSCYVLGSKEALLKARKALSPESDIEQLRRLT